MKLSLFARLRQDITLSRVLRNSSYLFLANILGVLLTFITAKLLGVQDFGILGIVTVFTSSINRLFSFRMNDTVVKYMGEAIALDDKERASSAVKMAMLIEGGTSLLAFGVLVILAPLGALYVAKDAQSTPLFWAYGTAILANLINESSTGVLQVTNHYRSLAMINFVQTVLVAILLGIAAILHASLWWVLLIYLFGKLIVGMGPMIMALYWLPRALFPGWWRTPLSKLPDRKGLARFAIRTNLSATVNLVARDNELTYVGYFFGPVAAGYFKIAMAIINMIGLVINPFISTTYPEITRAYSRRDWLGLRSLLKRVTWLSSVWTGAVAIGLVLFGTPILFTRWTILGRTFSLFAEYAPAYPLILILLLGYGVANIFFWNRSLVLAEGMAGYALKVGFWGAVVKLLLMVLIVPQTGPWAEALLLSLYLTVTVGLLVARGLRQMRQAEAQKLPPLEGGAG